MRAIFRRFSAGVVVALASSLLASAAISGPIHFYSELLTSHSMAGLPGDLRAQIDASVDMGDAFDIVLDGSLTRGDGLGGGYVGADQPVTYTHRFQPTSLVETILSAELFVATVDDGFLDGREAVTIDLDGQFWASGNATFNLFSGSVSASLFQTDGAAVVTVASTLGDVNLVASLFRVVYSSPDPSGTGSGATAVPEPSAMALFAVGLCVVGAAKRRR